MKVSAHRSESMFSNDQKYSDPMKRVGKWTGYALGFLFAVFILPAYVYTTLYSAPGISPEIAISELSPRGASGGAIIPASCGTQTALGNHTDQSYPPGGWQWQSYTDAPKYGEWCWTPDVQLRFNGVVANVTARAGIDAYWVDMISNGADYNRCYLQYTTDGGANWTVSGPYPGSVLGAPMAFGAWGPYGPAGLVVTYYVHCYQDWNSNNLWYGNADNLWWAWWGYVPWGSYFGGQVVYCSSSYFVGMGATCLIYSPPITVTVVNPGTAPTLSRTAISAPTVLPNGVTQYDITIVSNDPDGTTALSYAMINYIGPNTPNYRGYIGWSSAAAFRHWGGGYATPPFPASAGGGFCAKQSTYGPGFLMLDSCRIDTVGSVSTVTFTVRIDPSFTTPLTANEVDAYVEDSTGLSSGWVTVAENGPTYWNQFNVTTMPSVSALIQTPVSIAPASPPNTYSVYNGETGTITWTASPAVTSCTVLRNGVAVSGPLAYPAVQSYNFSAIVAPTTLRVDCTNAFGTSPSGTFTLNPLPPPAVTSVTLNGGPGPLTINDGDPFTLAMTSSNAQKCLWSRTTNGLPLWTNAPVPPAGATSYNSGALIWPGGNTHTWTFICGNDFNGNDAFDGGEPASAPSSITLTISPPVPVMTVLPALTRDFGDMNLLETKPSTVFGVTVFTIRNDGSASSRVTGAVTESSPHFSCQSGCNYDLASGASQSVVIAFTPQAVGDTGAVPVDLSCVTAGCTGATLLVWGRGVLPIVGGALDFGRVPVTRFKEMELTITNNSLTANYGNPTFSTGGSTVFECRSGCVLNLAPGVPNVVRVRFTPAVLGPASLVATLVGGAVDLSSITFTLSGEGVNPYFDVKER